MCRKDYAGLPKITGGNVEMNWRFCRNKTIPICRKSHGRENIRICRKRLVRLRSPCLSKTYQAISRICRERFHNAPICRKHPVIVEGSEVVTRICRKYSGLFPAVVERLSRICRIVTRRCRRRPHNCRGFPRICRKRFLYIVVY